MRVIKFRAWDNLLRKMMTTVEHAVEMSRRPEFEVMQYTGLKDKNGKEIYEGDLVRLYEYPWMKIKRPEIVKWVDYACGFEPFNDEIKGYGYPSAGEMAEVIGNIHENPELLGNQQS